MCNYSISFATITVPQIVFISQLITPLNSLFRRQELAHTWPIQKRKHNNLIFAPLLTFQTSLFPHLLNSRYCERISTLIQNGTDEWQNLWQLAIKELFHNSEIFQNPVNNINAINILLKVIEKAFKVSIFIILRLDLCL